MAGIRAGAFRNSPILRWCAPAHTARTAVQVLAKKNKL
jgi:hypothetical protein